VSNDRVNTPSDSSVTPQVSLTGVVERITFHSEESGYTVARLQPPRARELTTIVGNFANIQAGQTLQLLGTWKERAIR
jgi:exodeoxyribonuclease V alpha subunit